MVKKLYTESYIQNIADAIREVNGKTTKYYVRQMAEAILDLGGGDNILDNGAGVGVVDLATKVTAISDYKMYNADMLETVEASNLNSLGHNTFEECGNLYSVKTHQGLALNEQTFRYCTKLYKVCPEDVNYVGTVSAIPFTSVTLAENPHGNPMSYQTVSDYQFSEGDLVFNEADSKLYIYDGSAWSIFIPEHGLGAGKNAFNNTPHLSVLPFAVYNVYGPTIALTYKTNSFCNSSLRNVYLDADNFTSYDRGSIAENMFESATKLEKVWVIKNGQLSDDISLIFTAISNGMFNKTTLLKSMTFTNVTALYQRCFSQSVIDRIIAPNVTAVGEPMCDGCPNLTEIVIGAITSLPRYFAASCPNLEKVSIGNGTAGLSLTNWNPVMFIDCTKLWQLTLNTTTMAVAATDERQGFNNTPILNFLGTTTTEITEGSTATSVEINGSTVTATNNKIVSYGGKDWILTSGSLTEWGTDGDKHPCIKVPSALIPSYKADQYWSLFNEELWTAL